MPQAVDLEEAVLGAIMLEVGLLNSSFMSYFNPKVFYKDQHKTIAEAILILHKQAIHPDILLVTHELKKMGELESAGGAYYLSQLMNRVASSTNIEYHYAIIFQQYVRREVIQTCSELINDSYDDALDPFDLLDKSVKLLSDFDPIIAESIKETTSDIRAEVEQEIAYGGVGNIILSWESKWKKFNRYIGTGRDRIIVLAGASGDGKSRFMASWMYNLLESFNDIAVCWYCMEDSPKMMSYFYLAQKMRIKTIVFEEKRMPASRKAEAGQWLDKFDKFDIAFYKRSERIADISKRFYSFCKKRPDKLNILVIDNVLSLRDSIDFKKDRNSMYDYICHETLNIRQITGGMIVMIHHFNDDQLDPEWLKSGFRPSITHIKGTEGFRRIANVVALINNPQNRSQLIEEYTGEIKENLKSMFIIDPGKVRGDSRPDDSAVIYMFKNLDYLNFEEIPNDNETNQ